MYKWAKDTLILRNFTMLFYKKIMCCCRLLILSFEIVTYYLKCEKYRQKFDESTFNVFLFFFYSFNI